VAAEAYQIDNVIYAVQSNEYTRRHEHLTKVSVTEAASLREVPPPVGKILLEGERPALDQAMEEAKRQGWTEEYGFVFSGWNLLEITVLGTSKGNMVHRLAQRLGIGKEHIYCVGDEANDLSMLLTAAEGFAPANAIEAVRSSGVTLVSHAQDDALADVVERLEKKYG